MSCRFRVYIATSLDGFIARTDGSIDWLTNYQPPSPGEDYGYSDFMKETDTMVIGRKTYELVLGFGTWPYLGKKVLVITTRKLDLPTNIRGEVSVTSDSPENIAAKLSKDGSRSVYIDGGQTIQSFIRAGLVEEMTITRAPVLLGQGIPLFGRTDRDIKMEHVRTRSYANGFVQTTYRKLLRAA